MLHPGGPAESYLQHLSTEPKTNQHQHISAWSNEMRGGQDIKVSGTFRLDPEKEQKLVTSLQDTTKLEETFE